VLKASNRNDGNGKSVTQAIICSIVLKQH